MNDEQIRLCLDHGFQVFGDRPNCGWSDDCNVQTMVPVTRLQAIVDAWNAAGQTFPTLSQDPPARGRETIRIFWPELASAIEDAPTEDKT